MYCSKCGKEVEKEWDYCNFCGEHLKTEKKEVLKEILEECSSVKNEIKDKIKNKKAKEQYNSKENETKIKVENKGNNLLNIIKKQKTIILVILFIIIFCIIILYKNTLITDKYLANYMIKNNGFNDNTSIKILDIQDIEYKNFNKLALINVFVEQNANKVRLTSISLINKKDDIVKGITVNTNLLYLLTGMGLDKTKAPELTKICAKYLQEYGEEVFNNRDSKEFANLIKEIGNEIGLSEARNYVNENYKLLTGNANSEMIYTLLFEKDSAYIAYIAFFEEQMEYVWDSILAESLYKQYENINKSYIQRIAAIYGLPYKKSKVYNVYDIGYVEVNNEDELEKHKVGSYKTLEEVKEALNVETESNISNDEIEKIESIIEENFWKNNNKSTKRIDKIEKYREDAKGRYIYCVYSYDTSSSTANDTVTVCLIDTNKSTDEVTYSFTTSESRLSTEVDSFTSNDKYNWGK